MKAAAFDYRKADSLAAALQELGDAAAGAKPVAGSQSLGPMLNLRLARPARIVDISKLQALREVTATPELIRIGASVTHAEIEDGKHELLRGSFLEHVAAGIAYRAIRNRGTIGGSLAHADPAADWPLALSVLDARLELVSAAGKRLVKARDFMLGAFTTLLSEGEIIAAVLVPRMRPSLRWGYYKLCRKTGEFAHASAAAAFDARTGLARIAVGALDGPPACLDELASAIARQGPAAATPAALAAAVAVVMPKVERVDRGMHEAALARCLAQAFGAGRY